MPIRAVESYSGLERTHVEVAEPKTIGDLRECLVAAGRSGRSVTIRGGGHSFDSQSLNDDLVIQVAHLNHLEPTQGAAAGQPFVTLQPGVTWGDVVRHLAPRGLMPYILVTSSHASVGGTLAANSISRCSPFFGKEGAHVNRISVMTPRGDILECSRAVRPDLFHAAIGGFGYLGAITSIRHELMQIETPAQVLTDMRKSVGLDNILSEFRAASEATADWSAAYAMLFNLQSAATRWRGFIARSRYTTKAHYGGLLLYNSQPIVRVPLQFALSFPAINRFALNVAFDVAQDAQLFADDVFDYTFFMDGHTDVKHLFQRAGRIFRTIQQTFVVPDPALAVFIETVARLTNHYRLIPTLLDILRIPRDEFLLSATRGMDGIAVSLAFDRLSESQAATIRTLLLELSSRCADLRGRVHLVKNVMVRRDDLQSMYGEAARAFLDLKTEVDPSWTLRNGFFDRVIAPIGARA